MTRDQRARVLRAGRALEHRLGEVAGLRGQGRQRARARSACQGGAPRAQSISADDDRRRDHTADEPGVRLGRRDVGQEAGRARSARPTRNAPVSYAHTARTRSRIQPVAAPSTLQRRARRQVGAAWPSRTTNAEHADVHRRRRPSRSSPSAPRADRARVNAPTAARTTPTATSNAAAAGELRRDRGVEDDGQGDRDPEHDRTG